MAETVRKYSLAALRHRLFKISLVFTVALAMAMAIFVFTTSSTNAATYQTNSGGTMNWTGGLWTCTAGAPGSTACGAYPGSTTVAGDIAKITNVTVLVNSPLAGAVTLDMSAASGQTVRVQSPGVLPLTGNSVVSMTGTSGSNQLAIEGGTLSNAGNLTIGGGTGSSSLNFPGGTFSGAGVTTVTTGGSFSVSSTIGPAPTISQQIVNANNTASFNASTLTLSNGATINNGGTFTINTSGTIAAGAGGGLFTNSGSLSNVVGLPFTMNVPFVNTGTASEPSSLVTSNFNGGSGPGGHSNATWSVAGPSGVLGFGGTHLFTGAQTFPAGSGTINITGPSTFDTTATIGSGINVNNSTGTIDFGGTAPHTLSIAGGSYQQGAASTLKVKLGPTNGVSDAINVTGAATITPGATLIASLGPGYTPVNGDTFTVLSATGGVTGTYNYTPLAYSNGFFQISYSATAVVLVAVPQTDISVAKSGPASVNNGQNASYLITVTNTGPSAATGISISDTFTGPATFVSATPSTGTCSGTGPVTCSFPGLAVGNSATVTLVLTANATGTINNTAALSGTTPPDSNSLNNSATVSTAVTPAADLGLGITAAPSPANAASVVTFTATIANAGPDPAAAPAATFSLTNGTVTGASGVGFTCSFTTTTATCNATGPMPSAGGGTIQITTQAPNQAGTMTLSGSVSSTTFDPNSVNNSASSSVTINAVSDVGMTKSITTSPVVAGQNVVFSIVVSNAGPSDAAGVVVSDTPSAGLTFVSNSGACTTAFPCTLATIPSGSSVTITSTWLVAPSATGTIGNTASASAPGDPNAANNTASTTPGTITTSADLSITKALTSTLVAGSNATYSITVTNNGPSDALGVTVTDTPGAGLTFVSNSGACTTAFPCNLGTLTAGATATITSTYAVSPTATGSISNTATVGSTSTPDPSAANNSSTATGTVGTNSDVAVLKSATGPATPGSNITFTIDVKNFGPSGATGVVVTDTPGAGLTFVSNSGACTTAFPCNIGTLTAGTNVIITSTFLVAPSATGSVTNTASVTSTSSDPIPGNNSATASVPVAAVNADLSITKTGPAALPTSGSVTFTITVKNNGPASALNVVVNDAASRLVFVSNSGACSTPFPCSLGTLVAGATASISSTFTVTPGAQFASNSASVSSTSPDPNSANNSASVNLGQSCPNVAPQFISPVAGQSDVPLSGSITWSSTGASSYEVYFGKAGTGCSTLVATVAGTSFAYSGLDPNTDYEVRVVAVRSGCPSVASQCIRFHTTQGACNLGAPTLLSPKDGTKVISPLKLQWGSVAGAESYHVVVAVDGKKTVDTTTTNTSLDVTVDNGTVTWSVTAIAGNCSSAPSNGTFNICSTPATPIAGVVGAPSAGRTYQVVVFNPSPTSVHIFEEADNDSFQNARSQTTSSPFVPYAHPASQTAQVFFYRVRALNECGLSGFSKVLRVVILPAVVTTRPILNVPAGTRDEQVQQIFIPGESERVAFTATTDRPWITRIDPSSGILPTEGITLNLHIDPSQLPNGTFTATIIITTSPLTSGRITTNGSNTKSAPVTINLITPVVPVDSSAISEDSLIIPAVGHLVGLNSQWRSDVRIFNPSAQKMKYVLNFLALGSSDVKQTTIETDAAATTALDDIIHNWYGVGEVGDSATGVLQVVPVKDSGSQSALASIVASRTYSLAGEGTLGEFIPGVPLKQFAGSGSRLSLQQIAQTSNFRTNFGLVEATGKPTSLLLTMFNSAGTKLFDLPVNLAANEQKLLNGLLTQQGVSSLTDGRMEVKVTGGDGKVTAYASVIDNTSQNPLFVPGQPLGKDTAQLYVVPGVADLNNGAANWRSDMRIFNAGSSPQSAELVFYPSGAGSQPFFATINVNAGEVKVLDNLLQSTFGTANSGGAVHVNTTNASQLVITARTYNQTAAGTLGQFVPGATLADAINKSGQSLNILQVEDSMRFRTNVGLAEMTGKPATVEISVVLPDSKVTPTIEVPLAANEFRQFGLSAFGLGNVYNARVSVHVVNGDGAVTAYGSVIDQITTAPTYVAAK